MQPIILKVGPFNITLLGIFTAIGVLVAFHLARIEARRKLWDESVFHNGVLIVIASGLVGARLYYAAVFSPQQFLNQPMQIFAVHEGGLSIQGGLLGGVIAGLLYFRDSRGSFLRAGDTIAPALILAQAIARIGCDVFGVEASGALPWTVQIDGRSLHPVQVYESMLNYLLFLALWSIRGRTGRDGKLFLYYIIGFGLNRFGVEFFRTNPHALGGLTVAHVTSVAMIAIAGFGLLVLRRRRPCNSRNEYPVPPGSKQRAAVAVAVLMVSSTATYYLIYNYLIYAL